MALDYNQSIKNILKTFTQEQADEWALMKKVPKKPLEDFISEFNDYSKEGFASLVVTQAMMPLKEDNGIEKSEIDKVSLFYNLMKKRLLKEGYPDDDRIDNLILEALGTSSDIDKLLDKEMGNNKTNEI